MLTCANCSSTAIYQYRVTPEFKVNYCNSCLPKFLTAQKKAGLLKPESVAAVEVVAEPVVKKTTKKKTSSVG